MKYQFVIKDDHVRSKGEPVAKALGLFKVFVEFDSWYRTEVRLPGTPDIVRHGDDYIDVQVDDSVTREQIIPILDRLGYKPLENPAPSSRQ